MSSRAEMSVLRWTAWGAAVVLAVVGVGLAFAFLPVLGSGTLALTGAGAGWAWSRAGRPWPRRTWPSAVVAPLAVVAAAGWVAAGGPVVAATAVALTWVTVARGRRAPDRSYPVSAPDLPSAGGEDLDRWTDAQLCHVWRATYRQVAVARTPQTLAALVDCRRVVLDQLELRDPAGFSAWLEAGAGAAGNPEPYLSD